ncbi:hypothetical protein PHYSODRAFT_253792 [Phytophthora sojae]|uniref:Uncharacterized protein n=1 Tax=Phytophthora sojae (strain P6497) TaxID=1094619 RepID=G4YRW1_PHYSP|nr:hypothetical protein PHYSODRAFT_253792 [Phytophthora sojae]EGZ22938.1 hypothetical protein PHYSODRAFT_253792 [Phytophthora sojae]|eukprot:XP_009518226.1 hypothetical protein PHYSODRAFT_253792 [Phytophthora sojae]
MPPEEQLSLERNARRTDASRRKAARDAKESTEAQGQPDAEPAAQDAHHVSLDAATPDDEEKGPPSGSEVNSTLDSEVEVVGVSIPNAPAQASVGGAVKVESSAVVEPSGTSRPAQDVIVLDDDSDESPSQARTIKAEGPLPAVQEGPASSLPNETPLPSSPVPNAAPVVPPRVATPEVPRMLIDLTGPDEDSGERESAARMREFVADQPALDVHALEDAALDAVKEEHPDDDVPMPTREMDVLGRESLTTMRVTQDAMARVDASVQEMNQQLQDKDDTPDRKTEADDEEERTFQTYRATQLLVGREDALENQCALDTQAPVQVITSEATTENAREIVGAIQEDALKRAREAVKAERAQEEHLRSEAEAVRRVQEATKLQVQEAMMQKTLEERRRLLEEQQKLFDRKIALLETAQSRDKVAGPDQGMVRRTRSRDTRTTSSQVQGAQATPVPDPTVQVKQETGRLTMHQEPSGVITGHASDRRAKPDATTEKSGSKPAASSRPEPKKTATRKDSLKKRSSKRGDPSDDSSSSGSSEEDSSDEDSDSSSGEVLTNVTTVTTQGGTMIMSFRPYMSSSALEDFNEDTPLAVRRLMWEKFQNLATQGGWSDRTRVCELKLKMSPGVRNCRGLDQVVQVHPSRVKVSENERYYTMTQRKGEKAQAFLYRLNIAAEHAKVDFRKSSKQREMHIRQFILNLHDERTKAAVESHRFK